MTSPLLAVEDLGLRFGPVVVLDGVTFAVEAGERIGLVGANGAGKTSVLNCVSGVERPTTGRIRFRGADLAPVRPWARARLGIARTLQSLGVVEALDVRANLLLGRDHLSRTGLIANGLRLPRARAEEADGVRRAEAMAAALGLQSQLAERAAGLDPGARKRLELGRALVAVADAGADVLLLDEPFAGAGPADVELMVAAIRAAGERGAAVIVVDHDLDALVSLVDRAVILDVGRLVPSA